MNYNLKRDELSAEMDQVQQQIGYKFKHPELFMEAITHPSYAVECNAPQKDNQRLEFLGDAVLQLILSTHLFDDNPDAQEGILTRMRSFLANEEATASYTRRLGLDRLLLLGKGENKNHGRERPSILGDLFEAFLGAIYRDGGYEAARTFCMSLIPDMQYVREKLVLEENPKGALQELVQGRHMGSPKYELLSKTGADHAPTYELRVVLDNRELARAFGKSQREAERNAAMLAYRNLQEEFATGVKIASPVQKPDIIALDFDGVICDSAAETAVSGWKAARQLWPQQFTTDLPAPEQIEAFRKVRPYLETGYQSILLMKMLQDGMTPEEISQDTEKQFQRIMDENHLDKQGLMLQFGGIRDSWISEDLDGWLGWHSLYPGVADALKTALQSPKRLLILTTKQERFVSACLKNYGIAFPGEDIWGLERNRPKEDLLYEQLLQHPRQITFVEDRFETLRRVEMDHELEKVQLFYADWGYGTAENLEKAQADPHIQIKNIEEFCKFLGMP